uniref:Zinc finger DNA binding protein n=1 Tax=Rhodnius prolixus TaxID=13249 RepID=T1I5F6_RHOPR
MDKQDTIAQRSAVGTVGGECAGGGGIDATALILSRLEQGFNNIVSELSSVKSELKCVKSESQNVSSSLNAFKNEIKASVESLKNNLHKTNKKLLSLHKELNELKAQLMKLQTSFNYTQQFVHYDGLRILNVPYKPDENILEIIKQIAGLIDYNLDVSSIKSVFRIKGRASEYSSPIILKFFNASLKTQFINFFKKKGSVNLGTQENPILIKIFEEMSPSNYFLYKKARELKVQNLVKYVWFRGGRVLIRKEENTPAITINSFSDIVSLKGLPGQAEEVLFSDEFEDVETDVSSQTSKMSLDGRKKRRRRQVDNKAGPIDVFLRPCSPSLDRLK